MMMMMMMMMIDLRELGREGADEMHLADYRDQ
jgi:hypothetical protein